MSRRDQPVKIDEVFFLLLSLFLAWLVSVSKF